MNELLLAIDAGTGSVRAVLFDADGRQVAIGQREYSHAAEPGVPGSQVFDTAANWGLACACIAEAIERAAVDASAIRAVATTSMREGMVLYDGGGREIWACPNVDSRAGAEAAELVESGAAEEIYALAGDWVAITAPARLRWIARNRPEVFAGVRHMGMLGDWLATRLSGEYATDVSLGSSSGMFDLAGRTWSETILELVGPRCGAGAARARVGDGDRRGHGRRGRRDGDPARARRLSPAAPTPSSGCSGSAIRADRSTTVVGGSFWQHTMVLDHPLIDPKARLRTLCHAVPGTWMIEGIGFYSGLTMRWFRDAFCADDVERAAERSMDVYDLLAERAAGVPPGSNGVLGIFSNVMHASRWIHASPAFVQFDISAPERSGKNECFRAIQEAAAYVSRGHRGILEEIAGAVPDEIVFTGGASHGAMWAQILADVHGVPVRVPVVKESTALGAAICAGLGAGIYGSLEDADRLVRFERTVEPNPDAVAAYEDLYPEWLTAYERLLELAADGVVRPLWRAAGT